MQRFLTRPCPSPALLLLGALSSAAAAPASADALVPRGDGVVIRQAGGGEVQVALKGLVVAEAANGDAPPGPAVAQTLRFASFHQDGNGFSAEATAATISLHVHLGWESGAGFTMRSTAVPLQATWVRQLAVEIELDAEAIGYLGRDLRPRSVDSLVMLSRFDPKWVTLYRRGQPFMTVLTSDDIDGLEVRRLPGRARLRIDLLAAEARPFVHFAACTDYWKDPNQRLVLPVRLLEKGEAQEAQTSFYLSGTIPLAKGRYPDGRRGALVITDHADQTAAHTLRALAGGTSDTGDQRWGQGGLLGHGIPITKALWLKSGERDGPGRGGHDVRDDRERPREGARPGHNQLADLGSELELMDAPAHEQADENGGGRPQLDDPQVVTLADYLFAAGWEVIPHSATPTRDSRDLTGQALNYFRRFSAKSWIDHQPYTNCEALVNQGYRPGRYGITDLLHKHGYSYAWAGQDLPPGDLNLFSPRRMDRYAPVLWPVGRVASGMPADLWLFRSMLAFIETTRFFNMYTTEAIDRLERERGIHIAHTYLEDFHPPHSWFGKRNLMVPGRRSREVVPDPRLDALLSSLAARVARGSLWITTIARLGDYLRAQAAIAITLEPDGSATLQAPAAVAGASFVLPRQGVSVEVDGRPPKGLRSADGETSFWVDLPAGRPLRVRLRGASGEPLSFRPGGP